MSFLDDKLKNNLLMVTIIGVAIFLIIISFYVLKISNNDYCGSDNTYNVDPTSNTIYDTVLDENNELFVQSIDFQNKKFNYYEYYLFCFNGVVRTNGLLELNVINGDGDVLGKGYFSNGSVTKCLSIEGSELIVNNNMVGLQCVNCNSLDNLTLANSISFTEPTITPGGVVTSESIDYNIIATKNCRSFTKTLFLMLIVFVSLMSLIWLIDSFTEWFKRFSFDGW